MFKLLLSFLVSLLFIQWVFATDSWTKTSFAMDKAIATDLNTIKITFNEELSSDVSIFDFILNEKNQSEAIIVLTWTTLSWPKELTLNTENPLDDKKQYSIVSVFASDKNGNTIDNGVESSLDLVFQLSNNSSSTEVPVETSTTISNESMNSAPVTENISEVPNSEVPTLYTDTHDSKEVELVAANETTATEVATWPAEILAIILALIAWWLFMFFRRKA